MIRDSDKRSPYALYKFLKDFNIRGEGRFFISQNGRVIFEDTFNIDQNLNKWFKQNGGVFIGMITSEAHIWSYFDKTVDNKIILDRLGGKLTSEDTLNAKNQINKAYRYDYEDESKEDEDNFNSTQTVFYWSPYKRVQANRIYQTFRKSITNTCFFDVIEKYITNKIDSVKNNKYYLSSLNKLNKYKQIYKDGCPEESLQELADEFKMNFNINDIFNNKYIDIRSDKAQTTIKYINSIFDHLDENNFVDNENNVIEIETQNEMYDIINKKQSEDEAFYYTGNLKNIIKIYTQEGTYTHINTLNQIIKDFNNKIKIYDFAIDYLKDKNLSSFLHTGVIYSAHCQFSNKQNYTDIEIESNPDFIEYDMITGYTQYKKSSYYQGFPTYMTKEMKLDNFTKEDIKKFVGYYRVIITDFTNQNTKLILSDLGIEEGKEYILPSPELLLYSDWGVGFKVISGSYCLKTFDIEMSEEMFNKIDGKKPYAIWAGKLNNRIEEYNTVKTISTKKLAEQIADVYDVYITDSIFNDKSEIMRKTLKESIPWLGFIGGFITSYTRCNLLNTIFSINHNLLIGYKLDGFIKLRDDTDKHLKVGDIVNDIYKIKPQKSTFNWGERIFIDIQEQFIDTSSIYSNNRKSIQELSQERINILLGQGGSGKTDNILKQFDCMYIASSWKLISEKVKEYGCRGMTYQRLLGVGCDSYLLTHKPPKIILLDEITQIHILYIEKIIEMLPYTQIFLAGDIDEFGYYQCEFQDVKVLNINEFKQKYKCSLIKFTKNYRCKDEQLQNILLSTRNIMRESKFNTQQITNHIKNVFSDKFIDDNQLKQIYNYKSDWVLVSTTNSEASQTAKYTKMLNGNKYLCIKHFKSDVYDSLFNLEKKVYLQGHIIIDPEQSEKTSSRFEQRDAFTIHSFQGITIKAPSKLFIHINQIFCPRQLYTAISRVEYLNQIYFIK